MPTIIIAESMGEAERVYLNTPEHSGVPLEEIILISDKVLLGIENEKMKANAETKRGWSAEELDNALGKAKWNGFGWCPLEGQEKIK